jgi:hypothetical protein
MCSFLFIFLPTSKIFHCVVMGKPRNLFCGAFFRHELYELHGLHELRECESNGMQQKAIKEGCNNYCFSKEANCSPIFLVSSVS